MDITERLAQRRTELVAAEAALTAEQQRHQTEMRNLTLAAQREEQRHVQAVGVLLKAQERLAGRVTELEELNHEDDSGDPKQGVEGRDDVGADRAGPEADGGDEPPREGDAGDYVAPPDEGPRGGA